jgi:hypothetical protein
MVGTIYKRTRLDENGSKTQRAEIRFDDIAGYLRTPTGGSSRQSILVVNGNQVKSRLLYRGADILRTTRVTRNGAIQQESGAIAIRRT